MLSKRYYKKLLKNLLDSPHFRFDSNLKLPTSPARFNSINNVLLLFFWGVVDVRMPNYNSTEREWEEGEKIARMFQFTRFISAFLSACSILWKSILLENRKNKFPNPSSE